MPRKSTNSEENPTPRRTSARIAAVQAASPAKSPVKSPRRKRKSTEPKTISEDTESQQSQVKSETSIDEINGLETASSTKDSVTESSDNPPKKAKTDEVMEQQAEIPKESVVDEKSEGCHDFEVVEKNDVPAPDSEEVKAAIAAQGEDGSLLVDFVQVDKSEIPSATSVEVKHIAPDVTQESALSASTTETESNPHPVNGDSASITDVCKGHVTEPSESQQSNEVLGKTPVSLESDTPVSAPAAGDISADNMNVQVTSQ